MIPEPSGHIVLYGCLCTDAHHESPDLLPRLCPGHRRPVVQVVENERPGPVATGHICPEAIRICPTRDEEPTS